MLNSFIESKGENKLGTVAKNRDNKMIHGKTTKVIRCTALILLISAISLCGCGEEEEVAEEVKVDVDAEYPSVKSISLSGNFIGTIETDEKVAVTPRLSGQVTSKYFKVGDHVNAGDVLFKLDDREYQIEKKNAEANVRSANAALSAQKARNQEAKASANEAIGTMDTKTIELYNSSKSAERDEYNAVIRRNGYCSDGSVYKSEEDRIKNLMNDADARAVSAREFTGHLNSLKDIYHQIASSDDPVNAAKRYGLKDSDIGTETDAEIIAGIYLKKKTQYDSFEQLQTAIDASTEAQKSAESEKKELDGSYNNNLISRIETEVNAQLENGNIATAQEAKLLADKLRLDYEVFTRMTMWADAQAKIAEGDAAVVTSDMARITAQTELETANLKLEYTTVKAPISGIIQEINIEQYGMASDQSPAYVISDPEKKKAVFYVTEDVKNNIIPGQKVILNKNGTDYEAAIESVGKTADEQKKLYKISASLSESAQAHFDAGLNVRMSTSIRKEDAALTIPLGAVYYSEGKPYVFVAKNGKAIRTDITTGISDQSDIQVITGLSQSDQVITSWSSQIKDQADVNVKNKPVKVIVEANEADEPVKAGSLEAEEESDPVRDTAEEVSANTIKKMVETTDRVNIRKGPGKDNEKLETVSKGSRFVKVDETDGWTKIVYNDQEAYIKSDYVRECDR